MEKQNAAMVHELCPICTKKMNESLAIAKRYRTDSKGEIEPVQDLAKIHNKAIAWSDTPCDECQKGIDAGAIMIIIIDQSKSGETPDDIYRTGNIFGVKDSVVKKWLKYSPILETVMKKRAMIMDYKTAIAVGLPVKYK